MTYRPIPIDLSNAKEQLIMRKAVADCKFISILTAAQWSHLSVLRVDLRDVSNSLTQHVHWNLITVLVLPVGCLIASSLNLGPAVSCKKSEQEWGRMADLFNAPV